MMSNPPSSLQQRQRLHRRQNSTPVVTFEAMKVANMPPQRQILHRRGQSLDQQRSPIRRQHLQQGGTVSITNLGQQILREAQQQRTARPGQQQQQQQQPLQQPPHHMDLPISPECGIYTVSSPTVSISGTPYEMAMNAVMQNRMQTARSQQYLADVGMPMLSGYQQGIGILDENNQHYLQDHPLVSPSRTQSHSSAILFERRMSQPDLRVQTEWRPHTPTGQIQTAHFPLTPPFSQNTPALPYSRSVQASPSIHSPYPVPMQRGRSLQGIIEHDESRVPFEATEMTVSAERRSRPGVEQQQQQTPTQARSSPDPATEMPPQFQNKAVPVLTSSKSNAGSSSPGRPALSPRRMSISDLNLEPGIEASIEETNITLEDIAQFIEGPDPVDNKWICRYEECNKKFGRKENIKSHVQTHLGDRQFRCDHCKKCFVRGHDLKRHAKIHTGTKPYPCLCGNAFARHDALTRHRQRGMCIGAFDGVVKKVIKRGRPRKHRPEMEERIKKAARTRQRTTEQQQLDSYGSSASSCSISSWGSPPTENMESLSIRGNSPPFDDMVLFSGPQQSLTMDSIGFPPDTFSFTPPSSPGYSTGNKPSPSHRALTPADLGDIPDMAPHAAPLMPELPVMESMALMTTNAMSLQHSQHSLPSLSHSSSSPPAADMVAFDFSDMPSTAMQPLPMKMDPDRNDFDTFLDYGGMEMGLDAGGLDAGGSDSFFANL